MTALFVGSSICTIEATGALILPNPFCVTITSRKSNLDLYVGMHEAMNCLVAYDQVTVHERLNHFERRRIADGGASCADPDASAQRRARQRRHFGFAAGTKLDGKGRIAIPSWLNERCGETHSVLVVGMGHGFEIWDLDHVLTYEDADLRLLARLHLDLEHTTADNGDHHETALPSVRPQRRISIDEQPRLRIQPLHAVQPRHDPIGGGHRL